MKNLFWHRNDAGLIEVKEFAADAQLALLRVSDPIISGLAQGYTEFEENVGNVLFPTVTMDKESGRFPAFGQEAFKIYETSRGLYQPVKHMVTQTGYIQAALSEHALGFEVDRRELNEWAGNADQFLSMKQMMVSQSLALQRENQQAVLATTSGNYASGHAISGAGKQWAGAGDPIKDLRQLSLLILKKIGKRPNTCVFSPGAWELIVNNASVLDRIKYGGTNVTPAEVTESMIASLIKVKTVKVAYAVYGTGSGGGKGQASLTMDYLWDSVQANNVVMAYVGPQNGFGVPSFGYTYERKNSPIVESYYVNQTKSQSYDTEWFYDSYITLTTAGALYYGLA